MAQIRTDTYKAISDNDMDQVLFKDPFSDVARKSKRNLIVAGFISLLISLLNLEISGFLGLKAANASLSNDIAQGVAFFATSYLLISFLFQIYIDYAAWKFEREKQETKPYFDLVQLFENQVSVTGEQITNATRRLEGFYNEESTKAESKIQHEIKSAMDQLSSISSSLKSLLQEVNPLIESWQNTIGKMGSLSLRLKVRFFSLWALDILFPVIIALLALYKSSSGVPVLFSIIMS